ncbi:hypothetical protein N7449_004406 [Penicillium cf. viridicatum]|uniref:Uncharacterized protein n=1 Tax=Penicillium cf. viridicatum TaxID=2972119 RepID=A0A9W9MJI1_9EURO|nr:hypothetical protein N7449_004406 [Penicillium cf. viridicatum]
MAKIYPSPMVNVVRSGTLITLVLFAVVLDEDDPGDEVDPGREFDLGDEVVRDKEVEGVETGVEVGKRLPLVIGWVPARLPIELCHKRLVEDGESLCGCIVRDRVRLGGLCKCIAVDVLSKTMTVVYRVEVPVLIMVVLIGVLCML